MNKHIYFWLKLIVPSFLLLTFNSFGQGIVPTQPKLGENEELNEETPSFRFVTEIKSEQKNETVEFDSVSCGLNFKAGKSYKVEKNEIEKLRNILSIK